MDNIRTSRGHELYNYVFWLFIIQGISLILLGIVILIYPEILFLLVATAFIWAGITVLITARRIRRFWSLIYET